MKKILHFLFLASIIFAITSCSKQAKWNHEQKKALRDALNTYREMIYLQDLTDPEFVIFTDGVAEDIEVAYPVYTTFVQLPAVDDTLDMFVVTAIVEQLNESASNMRHIYPYRTLVKQGILPDKLSHEEQHLFYKCLAQKVNNYYTSPAEFLSDIIKSDTSAQSQIGKFQAECANDLFDWVIEVTEVDIIEPATTPAATPTARQSHAGSKRKEPKKSLYHAKEKVTSTTRKVSPLHKAASREWPPAGQASA